jgi:hypothetical protein
MRSTFVDEVTVTLVGITAIVRGRTHATGEVGDHRGSGSGSDHDHTDQAQPSMAGRRIARDNTHDHAQCVAVTNRLP